VAAGCTEPHWSVLPYPIPMALAGGDGALLAAGTADIVRATTPFPLLIDTATILTTFNGAQTQAQIGGFTMFSVQPSGATVPRFNIQDVPLFETPLTPVGVGASTVPIGGILAGDNLSRFVVGLDYRGAAPAVTLTNDLRPCTCELSLLCQSVMTFTLAGGQDTQLQGQTYVAIGNNLYIYPPTRVMVDACLEPLPDPLTATGDYARCATNVDAICPTPQYRPSGADVKLVIATGFPGLGLSANAYDRLRGAGAAAALLAAGPTVALHLGDAADEGTDHAGIPAVKATLGRPQNLPTDKGASAMALVSHEQFFGPCAELARSRRLRRNNVAHSSESACLIRDDRKCSDSGAAPLIPDPFAQTCDQINSNAYYCNDQNNSTPAAAVVELTAPLDIYVLPDVTPLLVSLNADVRPTQPTIDGVIGTTALSRMVMTIDYPNKRLAANCASASDCIAFAELTPTGACDGCIGPSDPRATPFNSPCAVAP
jgi:hypothetical protein